jgi:hydrogenase nickel incorporation protein HypA/HybF
MHEFSIALNIVDIALKAAKDANAIKVNKVEIDIGMLSGVVIEALEFALESAVKSTLLEGSQIKINKIRAAAMCNNCHKSFEPDDFAVHCPVCKSADFDITRGRELSVKSIDID